MTFSEWHLTPAEEPLKCFVFNKTTQTYSTKDVANDLNETVERICFVHIVCFIFLFLQTVIEGRSLQAHSSLYFASLTIPLYIYIVLKSQYSLISIFGYESAGCFSNQMGTIKHWLTIELLMFYLNLIVLVLFLIRS